MLLTLTDVDQLLDNTAALDASTPAPRLRGGRDDLVHVAVLLSYARHVLSVDIGALEAMAGQRPRTWRSLSTACRVCLKQPRSVGDGRCLPTAPATTESTATSDCGRSRRSDAGARRTGPSRPSLARSGTRTLRDIEAQVSMVSERRELVEKRVREVQALLVEQYKRGDADPDDWVR